MAVLITIIPIFIVIFLGWLLRRKGFIPPEFVGPANRLAYYLAIPAMVFHAISKGSFSRQFNPAVLLIACVSIMTVFIVAFTLGRVCHFSRNRMGAFVQSTFHGNLGFVGLAISFYYLGNDGLARAGILAGFLMILQNFLAVVVLQLHAQENRLQGKTILKLGGKVLGNPVILSAMAGIAFSVWQVKTPAVLERSLQILSGLGLPMALLLIGAALSFHAVQQKRFPLITSALIKLIVLPGTGFFLYRSFAIPNQDYLPGLILLASPTATLAYVMAGEMNSDTVFAGSAISMSTLASAASFTLWISLGS
jgi:hypothetical protein